MFSNPIEAWAKAEVASIEAKVKAIDADHDGLSDVEKAVKLFEEGMAELKVVEPGIVAALNLPPEKAAALEASIGKLLSAVSLLQGVATALKLPL